MHQQHLANTALGRPIALHTSWPTGSAPPGPTVGFIGGVHGDEPEGVWLAQKTLTWLQSVEASLVKPWWLIECLNLDGYIARTRTNGRGVDLNRNFPSQDWSSESKADRYHPGPAPASEPETKGLIAWLKKTPTSLLVHAHSWNPCLVLTGDKPLAEVNQLAAATGYELLSDIGYSTPGSLGSYGWHALKIPVLCIEEKEGENPEQSWQRFGPAIPWLFWTDKEARRQGLKL